MTSSQGKYDGSDRADHLLYRTYHALMLPDLLKKMSDCCGSAIKHKRNNGYCTQCGQECNKDGIAVTKENKLRLHDFHKKILGYKSTSNLSQEQYSFFLFEVTVFWATEKGIFVRTKEDQPIDIQNMSFFAKVITKKGRIKRVIDLL